MTAKRSSAKKKKASKTLTYEDIRKLALSLELPGVTEAVSWGQPCLKAHGKLWFFWSPQEDAPAFKASFDERDMLVAADPDTFYFTAHFKSHEWVLARPDRIDREWIKANLIRVWRAQAPKKVLKAFDAENGA